uniref:Secreted protein n=1 Tax=Angiostrongylus cantonensis TaxID=6313 RepID=A0A0K0DH93_ANGCA
MDQRTDGQGVSECKWLRLAARSLSLPPLFLSEKRGHLCLSSKQNSYGGGGGDDDGGTISFVAIAIAISLSNRRRHQRQRYRFRW